MRTAKCINCEEDFKGRLNKKFCSSSCKNQYHNERNREKNSILISLNKTLHKNWQILDDMYRVYKSAPVKLDILEAAGFKSSFHTHTFNSPVGEKYIMIYDFGFKKHFDNHVQIVRNEESAVA